MKNRVPETMHRAVAALVRYFPLLFSALYFAALFFDAIDPLLRLCKVPGSDICDFMHVPFPSAMNFAGALVLSRLAGLTEGTLWLLAMSLIFLIVTLPLSLLTGRVLERHMRGVFLVPVLLAYVGLSAATFRIIIDLYFPSIFYQG